MKYLFIFALSIVFSCNTTKQTVIQEKPHQIHFNEIKFERSPFGLIFTDIEVQGRKLKAMIDFGDPHVMQISSSMTEELDLEVTQLPGEAGHIDGSRFDIYEGTTDQVKIGTQLLQNVKFASMPGEMESVSEQIGTEFHASVGWGYFRKYFIKLNYLENQIILNEKEFDKENVVTEIDLNATSQYLSFPVKLNDKSTIALLDTGSTSSLVHGEQSDSFIPTGDKLFINDTNINVQLVPYDLSMISGMGATIILGSDFLDQYIIHIDPFSSKMYLCGLES